MRPRLGIAYSGYTPAFLARHSALVDYVEVPFELLQHDPSVIEIGSKTPIILHCASLSLGGNVAASPDVFDAIKGWLDRTESPWLGEHLSFITADRGLAGAYAEEYAPGEPYNLGYTVSPPMNAHSVRSVIDYLGYCQEKLSVPLLLENPPQYFKVPGTTMRQVDFISEICARSNVGLLFDVTHFFISAHNMGFDALAELHDYPLDRVVEVHLSGALEQENARWDDHAHPASEEIYNLFRHVLTRTRPAAITLEYNWSARFPEEMLLDEIEKTREAMAWAASVATTTPL